MNSRRQRLDRWVRQQALGDHDTALTKFVIKHAAQGKRGTPVSEHKVEKPTTDDIRDIVDTLENAVEEDAAGMGGIQRYTIESWHDEAETPSTRFTMRVEGHDPDLDDIDSDDAEPATRAGILSQQMRHNEVLMKSFVAGIGGAVQALQRTAARSAEQVEKLMEQRLADFTVLEDALSKRHERDMEALEVSTSIERKDKLAEKAMTLLPVLANRLAGKNLLPAPSPRDEMLRALVESLTTEQLNGIMPNLSPDQQIAMYELLLSFKKEDGEKPIDKPNGS